jgi:superfamily II DNA or RNA helicase
VDERLIAADPREVMRRMAEAYLAAPAITVELGEVCLAPHQVDAASLLLALLGEWGGAVLADATGFGKTFVAIAVARVMGPALVIAPAALRNMWKESLTRAGVVAGVESYERFSRGDFAVSERPALLVLDEAHHARNPRARRYAALADLAWGTKVLLLTATDSHNRARSAGLVRCSWDHEPKIYDERDSSIHHPPHVGIRRCPGTSRGWRS